MVVSLVFIQSFIFLIMILICINNINHTFVSHKASLSRSSSVRAFLAGGGPSPTGALIVEFVSAVGVVEVAGGGMGAVTGAPAGRTVSGVCGITGTGIIGTPIGG